MTRLQHYIEFCYLVTTSLMIFDLVTARRHGIRIRFKDWIRGVATYASGPFLLVYLAANSSARNGDFDRARAAWPGDGPGRDDRLGGRDVEAQMSWEAWGDPPDVYCEMCGCEAGSCLCEECPVCGEVGNPKCYEDHGLVETEEQIQSRIRRSPCDDEFC